jgi:murein L,D-transpeptidase YcbB/YkuD
MDAWGHLSDAQKQQARNTYGQLKAMPPDRQQQVNSAFRRLRAMPPSARDQVMNSPEFQSHYSEQERQIIRSMTDINSSLPHD